MQHEDPSTDHESKAASDSLVLLSLGAPSELVTLQASARVDVPERSDAQLVFQSRGTLVFIGKHVVRASCRGLILPLRPGQHGRARLRRSSLLHGRPICSAMSLAGAHVRIYSLDLLNVRQFLFDGEWLELRYCSVSAIHHTAYEYAHRARFMRATIY